MFGQLRYNYLFNDRNRIFSFYQIQKNKILELEKRQLFGLGYRNNILRNELDSSRLFKCDISIGVMQEEEILNSEGLLKDEIVHTNFTRIISSLVFAYNITNSTTLVNTTYYQPYIKELGDYRVLNETNLLIEINDWLSFNVDLEYRYDSDPPTVLTNTDFNTNCGIVIEL
jgi:putative salt-induced outer membrane protein YdiY